MAGRGVGGGRENAAVVGAEGPAAMRARDAAREERRRVQKSAAEGAGAYGEACFNRANGRLGLEKNQRGPTRLARRRGRPFGRHCAMASCWRDMYTAVRTLMVSQTGQ